MRFLPKSEAAQKIALLYRRHLFTPWSEKEYKSFKALNDAGMFETLEDLNLVIRYEMAEAKKNGYHRRDLLTFLNHYHGELDRARGWAERNKPRRPRPALVPGSRTDATGANILIETDPVADAEPEPITEQTRRFLEDLEARKARRKAEAHDN